MLSLPILSPLFADSTGSDAPFEPEDIINKLIPNFWDFLIQLIAFILLLVLVFFVAYKPLKKFVTKRKEYIEGNLRQSEQAIEEGNRFKKENEEGVAEARKEAKRIVDEAKKEATLEAEGIKDEARAEAKAMLSQADKDIAEAKERAIQECHDEVVSVAIEASKAVLGREVNEEDNKRLLKDFVKDLEDK